MASDLQVLVDHLAEQVGASAVLEDQRQRTVAHSCQVGPIDTLRRDSILDRATPPELVEWFHSFGILQARAPLAIPAHEEFGILPRLCAPVRYRDHLLGFLWVIDNDGTVSEQHLQAIEKAAGHAAVLLYEDELAQRLSCHALSQLLSPSEELRSGAAQQIVDQALLPDGQPTVIVVVQPLACSEPSDDFSLAIKEVLADVGLGAPPGAVLRLACSDHGVLLVGLRSCTDDAFAFHLATGARRALVHRLRSSLTQPVRAVASIGDPQEHLAQAVASYRQARLAVKVAGAIPATGDVVRWSELGVFRALAQLPTKEAQESAVDPRLLSLLDAGDETVISTLETFLDLAGDIKATAEALHLHRGTLYYRLEKAERLSGLDIHNGYDRLSAHLGLKLARLAGHRVTVPTVSNAPRASAALHKRPAKKDAGPQARAEAWKPSARPGG